MDSPIEKWNLIIGNLALKQVIPQLASPYSSFKDPNVSVVPHTAPSKSFIPINILTLWNILILWDKPTQKWLIVLNWKETYELLYK